MHRPNHTMMASAVAIMLTHRLRAGTMGTYVPPKNDTGAPPKIGEEEKPPRLRRSIGSRVMRERLREKRPRRFNRLHHARSTRRRHART